MTVVIHRLLDEEIERRTFLSMARRILAFEAKERTNSPIYRTIIRDFLNMVIVPEDNQKVRVVYKLPGKSRPTTDPSKALDAWKDEARRMKNAAKAREEAAVRRRNIIPSAERSSRESSQEVTQ